MPHESEINGPGAVVFREFLYADIDRARSLLAQRLGGVPEQSQVTDSTLRHYALGVARYLGAGRESKTEEYEQRSLLDALFPVLEELLEAEQWLTDISEDINDPNDPHLEILKSRHPAGSIVRLTAPSHLFDAEYVAHTLAATAAAIDGISAFKPSSSDRPTVGPGKKPAPKPKPNRTGSTGQCPGIRNLEDSIEEFSPEMLGDVANAKMFRAFVKASRGIFPSGLHLIAGGDELRKWTVSARLQKHRRYLDAESDVLFSRYGVDSLEWTIVGIVGHYAPRERLQDLASIALVRPDQSIDRTGFIRLVNGLMSLLAGQGLSSSPTYPGFSLIPIAVYRVIPNGAQSH